MFKTISLTAAALLSLSPSMALAGDRFDYNPAQSGINSARNTILASVFRCSRSQAFGQIIRGVRSKSAILRSPAVQRCYPLLRDSNWFKPNEKLPTFNRVAYSAIEETISTGHP